MHFHILGICGTFTGGLAQLLRAQGHRVTGSDLNTYEPMQSQLERAGIELIQGWNEAQLQNGADCFVVGNALSRGNPCVEYILNHKLPMASASQVLAERVLAERRVIGVAGTHGKTTTTSMLVHLLSGQGQDAGYLVGGAPLESDGRSVAPSAHLGSAPWFVVEADEYDSAFFDKRSKFVHYRPEICILNNLEFDHADIFAGIEDIERQFHHLVRMLPADGSVVYNAGSEPLRRVLQLGCWSRRVSFAGGGGVDAAAGANSDAGTAMGANAANAASADATAVDAHWHLTEDEGGGDSLHRNGDPLGALELQTPGRHNAHNAMAAVAAMAAAGFPADNCLQSLATFGGVRRRLELLGQPGGVWLYDDFAHHPSAIRATLQALRSKHPGQRLLALVEPRSSSMRAGTHRAQLPDAWKDADAVWWLGASTDTDDANARCCDDVGSMVQQVTDYAKPDDVVVIMSNGAFGGIQQLLLDGLK